MSTFNSKRASGVAVLLLAVSVAIGVAAQEAPSVDTQKLLFCVPGMPGSRTAAQPYIDQMLLRLSNELERPAGSLEGRFELDAAECTRRLSSSLVQIAALSPALYAGLRDSISMQIVAKVVVEGRASEKYFVVTRPDGPRTVEELKGKRLVGTQAYDARYVAQVLLDGALKPKELDLQAVKRPLKAVRDVARGKADAAIIDEPTLAALPDLPEAASLQVIHTSAPVPPPLVVVIGLDKKETQRIKKALLGLCEGDEGAQLCKSLMISSIEEASKKTYRSFVRQYSR